MWASSLHSDNTRKCDKAELIIAGVCLGHQTSPLWCYVLLVSIPTSLSELVQALVLEPTTVVAVSFCVSYEQLAKWVMNLGTSIRQIGSLFGNL